jgi:glycosyltransferase involved in cell wall biosynthesis
MAKISVIIPCYNASNYVSQCFASLSRQTYKDFNVVIVDDNSSDNTIDVICECVKKYGIETKLLQNSQNFGPSFSRKRAVEFSESEFVAFCDIDDWYDEDFLFQTMQSILSTKTDLVIVGYKLHLANKHIKLLRFVNESIIDADRGVAFLTGVDSLCVLIMKRKLFMSVPHPDIRNGEDMAVIPIIIANANSINILSDVPYNYVCREGSVSSMSNMNVVNSLLTSFKHVEDHTPKVYREYVEFLGISRVLYGSILNLFKFSYNTKYASQIVNKFCERNPKWKRNQYIKRMSLVKRFFVFCVDNHLYVFVKIMSIIHKRMTS